MYKFIFKAASLFSSRWGKGKNRNRLPGAAYCNNIPVRSHIPWSGSILHPSLFRHPLQLSQFPIFLPLQRWKASLHIGRFFVPVSSPSRTSDPILSDQYAIFLIQILNLLHKLTGKKGYKKTRQQAVRIKKT